MGRLKTRLIDANALKELFIQTLENIKSNPLMTGQEMHIITAIHTVGQMIDDAPTIIPAERGRIMNLNNPKTLDEAIEIIKEINPEYEETNTRTAETMVLCAVKDGELVDKHTIDAEPVRHGKWKQTYLDHEAFGERPSIFYCSACCACSNVKTNYCPQCGARMDKE